MVPKSVLEKIPLRYTLLSILFVWQMFYELISGSSIISVLHKHKPSGKSKGRMADVFRIGKVTVDQHIVHCLGFNRFQHVICFLDVFM
jgi:hypothetical protein